MPGRIGQVHVGSNPSVGLPAPLAASAPTCPRTHRSQGAGNRSAQPNANQGLLSQACRCLGAHAVGVDVATRHLETWLPRKPREARPLAMAHIASRAGTFCSALTQQSRSRSLSASIGWGQEEDTHCCHHIRATLSSTAVSDSGNVFLSLIRQ